MLANHDIDRTSPFASLLIDQPTLRRRIKLGVLAALDQRIAVRYHMTSMSGRTRRPPAPPPRPGGPLRHPALRRRHRAHPHHQPRLPRQVYNLAVQALVAAFAADKAIDDESSARTAVTAVTTQ